MRNYQIPTSISTELKIAKWMYLTDLFLLIGLLLFRQSTVSLVSDRLVIPYTIFIACVGLFLIVRPSHNPEKRMYHAVLYAIIRKKDTYVSIDKDNDKEGRE